jgi:hypothetical protein
MRRVHQAGAVQEVAEDEPASDADDEAGAEQERPVMDRDEGPADGDQRAGVGARGVLPQGDDREQTDHPHGDETAFDDARGDVAEREALAAALEDREQGERRPDVGNDEEQLEERSEDHAGIRAGGPDDVAGPRARTGRAGGLAACRGSDHDTRPGTRELAARGTRRVKVVAGDQLPAATDA